MYIRTSLNGHLRHLSQRPPLTVATSAQRPPLTAATSHSGHLSQRPPLTAATSHSGRLSQRPPLTAATSHNGHFFLADSPYIIRSCLNLSTTATSLQWQLSSVPKVAVVERFSCILNKHKPGIFVVKVLQTNWKG